MQTAPDFSLPDQNNSIHNLGDYAGKWLVLYFYPKDDTPGCTIEACSFRDEREAIAEFGGAEVVGVSADTVESHAKFAKQYGLNFTLLSDPKHKVVDAYDSWQSEITPEHEFIGVKRNTFIISPEGKIAKKYIGVDPKAHAAEIIADLQKLQK